MFLEKCYIYLFKILYYLWNIVRQLIKKFSFKKLNKKGFALILVAISIPVILAGINYAIKLIEKSNKDISKFEVPYIVALSVANHFNPGKSWDSQYHYLYSIGAQAYNDRHYHAGKEMAFSPDVSYTIYKSAASMPAENLVKVYNALSSYGIQNSLVLDQGTFLNDNPMFQDAEFISDIKFDQAGETVNYNFYNMNSGNEVDSIASYKEDLGKLQISFDQSKEIVCSCGQLKRKATVTLPKCEVDIIIAIPTNYASCTNDNSNDGDLAANSSSANTPIRHIAKAYQTFLQNFLHTQGVAVGVIPYSGKISLPPDRANWTVKIPLSAKMPDLPYVKQSMFYGSDGKFGGELLLNRDEPDSGYGDYIYWGQPDVGLPIMSRIGVATSHRGMTTYVSRNGSDNLLISMEDPAKSDAYKFMRANINPCYLGYCNTLAMLCEKDCPTHLANPYFITELTSDLNNVIHDLNLIVPINDKRNKSNFLFLPALWAGNLFSSWTRHPFILQGDNNSAGNKQDTSDNNTSSESAKDNRKRAVIIVANAPDNFEPVELTYLGFNNDNSEIPMYESDTILFDKGGYVRKGNNYLGVKGAIKYTTTGTTTVNNAVEEKNRKENNEEFKDEDYFEFGDGLVYTSKGKATISFPNKGIIKIVATRNEPANVTFYDENGVVDNVTKVEGKYKKHIVRGKTSFSFRGPQQVYNFQDQTTKFESGKYTTKGPNFGHNLSVKKLKFTTSRCILDKVSLSNQILRFYGTYGKNEINNKELIQNSNGSTEPEKRMDPCIDLSYTDPNGYNDLAHCAGSTKWSFSSDNDNYYIKAHNLFLTFKGISMGDNFVMAVDDLPDEKTFYEGGYNQVEAYETAKVSSNSGTTSVSGNISNYDLGDIYYNQSGGIKYRCYNGSGRGSNSNFIRIYTGGLYRWHTVAYYNNFVSQKTRSRELRQTVKTIKHYDNGTCSPTVYTTTSTGKNGQKYTTQTTVDHCPEQCCYNEPYKCNLGQVQATKVCKNGICWTEGGGSDTCYRLKDSVPCTGIVWNDQYQSPQPSVRSGWSHKENDSPKGVYCEDVYQPRAEFSDTFVKTQEQTSTSCNYDENQLGKSSCTFPDETDEYATDHNEYDCTRCKFNESTGKASGCSCSGKGGKSNTKTEWAEKDTQTKRFYKILDVDKDGNETSSIYKICDSSGNNCTNASYSSTCSLYPQGTFDKSKSCLAAYQYNMHNFFLVSGENNKSATFSYDENNNLNKGDAVIASDSDTNLLANSGVFLLPGEVEKINDTAHKDTSWICFCGDAGLSMDFISKDYLSMSFGHINGKYRVSLDNGVVVYTAGPEVNSIENVQTFYIIPEQIPQDKDKDGNYYIEMNVDENTKIISVEINNRPYKTIAPTVSLVEAQNGEKLISDEIAEFKTNLKTDFQFGVVVPYFWVDGQSDYQQSSGNLKICCNTKSTINVDFSVPSAGTGIYMTQDTPTRYRVFSDRKLKEIKINGYQRPKASIKLKTDTNGASSSAEWSEDDTINLRNKDISFGAENFHHTSEFSTFSGFGASDANEHNYEFHNNYNPERATVSCTSCGVDSWYLSNIFIDFWMENERIYSDIYTKVKSKCGMAGISGNTCNGHFDSSQNMGSQKAITFRGSNPSIEIDMSKAVGLYGSGYMETEMEHGSNAPTLAIQLGKDSSSVSGNATSINRSSYVSSTEQAKLMAGERDTKGGFNKLRRFRYRNSGSIHLLSQPTSIKFHGKAALRVRLTPQKNRQVWYKNLSSTAPGGSLGAYIYTFDETEMYPTVSGDKSAYQERTHYWRIYEGGEVNGTKINDGGSTRVSVQFADNDYVSTSKCYSRSISLTNAKALLSGNTAGIGSVGDRILSSGNKDSTNKYIITVSPADYDFQLKDDGFYHVKIPCKNVCISGITAVNTTDVRVYDHPDVKAENLQNTRILDGYDQGKNKNSKIYGDMKYDMSKHTFSAIQRLFYYTKDTGGTDSIYPYKSGNTAQLSGDFFIHIWDQNDEVPAVKWKLDGKIRDDDYTVDDYGTYRSNYAFAGLHRMFFPYDTYGKDYAEFSEALNSAIVFAGFTIPLNLMLMQNGYQTVTQDSGITAGCTNPNTAIETLAKDACTKLKGLKPTPKVYLIKYKTNKTLSLEQCADFIRSASSESDLKDKLNEIAQDIKINNQANDLIIDVSDI